MPPFLVLPREIRQTIYDHALVVGNVAPYRHACAALKDPHPFNPFNPFTDWQEYGYEEPDVQVPISEELPNTNLLKTCRLIHTEASPTLYSKNVWVLPMTVWTVKFFANSLYNDERRAWVKHVYLYLQAQDISVEERQAVASDTRLGLPRNVPQREVNEWTYNAYGTYLRTISWPRKVELILEHLALDSLAVNVCWSICPETVYCPLGISAIVAFADGFRYGMPTHFEIYSADGWDREATETMLRKWTEQRGETFIPLSKGMSENQDIIKSIEYYIAWEGTIRG